MVDDGILTAIANEVGKSVSYISQLYDPNNDRKSHLVRAIHELRAWRRKNPKSGAEALELLIHFVEKDLEPLPLCVVTETKKLKQQVDEWECVEMESAPSQTRIEEIRDIRLQAERTLNAHAQYLRSVARQAIEVKNGRAANV